MVKSRVLRVVLIIVGFISLGLGCVGIALPILPTVPFFLLTSFCFVKSSVRFNTWFLNSKLYHKYVENFAKTRAMILKNELILLLSVSAMLMTTIYFVNSTPVSIILTILIFCKYLYFVWQVKPINKLEYQMMRKQRAREEDEERQRKDIEARGEDYEAIEISNFNKKQRKKVKHKGGKRK